MKYGERQIRQLAHKLKVATFHFRGALIIYQIHGHQAAYNYLMNCPR